MHAPCIILYLTPFVTNSFHIPSLAADARLWMRRLSDAWRDCALHAVRQADAHGGLDLSLTLPPLPHHASASGMRWSPRRGGVGGGGGR